MPHETSPPRRDRRAGFTLVELLAVMAILSLLVGLTLTIVSKARASGNANACRLQLRDIALNMQLYVDERRGGKWPKERGVKFLLTMVKDDFLKGDELKKFACPGTDDETRRNESDPVGAGISDWEDIDPDCISYGGRDNVTFPIRKDQLSQEIIASDDNWSGQGGRPNHGGITNIVFADGRVDTVDTSRYKAELPEKQEWLPVGPDSPDDNLKKLAVD
jgi:prepilin-type N-terminal cleavage/methylation domain-containing protein/prepilin-type processing-associated H-X9-DG protein